MIRSCTSGSDPFDRQRWPTQWVFRQLHSSLQYRRQRSILKVGDAACDGLNDPCTLVSSCLHIRSTAAARRASDRARHTCLCAPCVRARYVWCTGPFDGCVQRSITVKNVSHAQCIAFKIMTTSPKRYCVRPSNGLLKPQQEHQSQGESGRLKEIA